MGIVTPHRTMDDADPTRTLAMIHPASPASVALVLAQAETDDDGRSNWVWLRLPNGDLILGVFPQGDTYFAVEEDAQFPEPRLPAVTPAPANGDPFEAGDHVVMLVETIGDDPEGVERRYPAGSSAVIDSVETITGRRTYHVVIGDAEAGEGIVNTFDTSDDLRATMRKA